MKKKLCVLMCGLCLTSISACGNKTVSDNSNQVSVSSIEEEIGENKDARETIVDVQEEMEKSESKQPDIQVSDEEERNLVEPEESENNGEDSAENNGGDSMENNDEDSTENNGGDSTENAEKDVAEKEDITEDNNKEVKGELVDGMRPEFKEAMDSYEAFYDEYCSFMKKYKENPSDLKLITGYADMMVKSVDMTKKFEEWENEDEMNNAELKYYLDVNHRVLQKLAEVAE